MKLSKKLNVLLLVSIFLLPLINFAAASKTPGYVGINKDDTYVWLIKMNSKPLEGFYEDLGYSEEDAEDLAEFIDDMEDIEAIRYTITDFEEEDEYGDFDAVEVSYEYYESKNYVGNKWKLKEQDEETRIFQYDEDIYKQLVFNSSGISVAFVATNVNWYYVAKETKNDWEDDYDDDADYKVIEEENGLSTEFEWDDDDVDKHESITLYTSTGVLKYYEWKYDGKVIIEMNLEMSFFSEYWFALLVLAVAAVVLVVVMVVIVIHGRKNMSPI